MAGIYPLRTICAASIPAMVAAAEWSALKPIIGLVIRLMRRWSCSRMLLGYLTLHLSEVKGPMMDRLRRSAFLDHLSGKVFVSQFEAFCKLTGRCASQSLRPHAKH